MINLGKISLKDETSIVESRNKIQLLAEDLKFDAIGATRLATITSELARIIYQDGEKSVIIIGFKKEKEGFSLLLIFQSRKEKLDIAKAKNFFDRLKTTRTKDGFQRVETFKYIPDLEFEPTKEFIDTEKERLIRLSRAELLEEVKRKNEELLRLLDELKVREKREKKLAAQAAQAEAMQEAMKTKSAFTGMVSHELRTPLAALKESVSQVQEGMLGEINEEQKKFLGIAKSNVDRLARLINEVLDFQTLEAGKAVFKMQDNDINEVVKEVRETMILETEKKNLDFIVQLDENLPKIRFDRDKLIQVLTNLVSNSLKLTERGGITITTTQGDNIIQVSVKDTGPGIKEEDMPRLFQQYEQLERKVGGTGLGLAISLEIIKAHGGKIWAESKFGQGTTFHFVLPIIERRQRG